MSLTLKEMEDYKIKVVEFGKDFTVKTVSFGQGCK